jgi:hypothetical protein
MGEMVRVRGNLSSFPLPLITRQPANAGIMKREMPPWAQLRKDEKICPGK